MLLATGIIGARADDMDGVMMSGGKMTMMKGGKPAGPIEHELTMSDGTRVTPAGLIVTRDGQALRLSNGDMVMMDGHVMHGHQALEMHPQAPR